jgi:hypothetical protein
VRESLLRSGALTQDESLAHALLRSRGELSASSPVDFDAVEKLLEEMEQVGKVLSPAPPLPGAVPVRGGFVSIQSNGNPQALDMGITGGWHFAQNNQYDAWFNIAIRPDGGYYILTPACRETGSQGSATNGYETVAQIVSERSISFQVTWEGGGKGNYQCTLTDDGQYIYGFTEDAANPGLRTTFLGTFMDPVNKTQPGNWPPARNSSDPQPIPSPLLGVEETATTLDNLYNVKLGGSGFKPNEQVMIQFRVVNKLTGQAITNGWVDRLQLMADLLGTLHQDAPFSIMRPPFVRYFFRAVGSVSGPTPEVSDD